MAIIEAMNMAMTEGRDDLPPAIACFARSKQQPKARLEVARSARGHREAGYGRDLRNRCRGEIDQHRRILHLIAAVSADDGIASQFAFKRQPPRKLRTNGLNQCRAQIARTRTSSQRSPRRK